MADAPVSVSREKCSINELSKRTDIVFENAVEAGRLISDFGYAFNGWGVLSDPSMTLSRLADARAAIDKALAVLRSTEWPQTDGDWDALERAHISEAGNAT